MSEHAQLIQSAFVSYLSAINPSPWAEDLTGDSGLRIFAGESNDTKSGTRIVCSVSGDMTEEPPCSGNRWADVQVELRTPVQDDGGVSFGFHQANAAALQTALMDVNLPDSLTSQSIGITVFGVTDRNPSQDESENYWASTMSIRVYSAPSYFA
jgi:hypothetical protein